MLILAALLVGVFYVSPQLLIWRKLSALNEPYVVMQLTHHGDEAYGTWSRYREIYDGHFPPGDLYFEEQAATPFGPFQFLPALMAGFIFLFRGNINIAYLASHFVIPIALFFLFYLLGRILIKDKIWSLFLGLVGTLTPIFSGFSTAFHSINEFVNIVVKNFYPLVKTPLPDLFLARSENPILTYLVLLPAIAALIVFWRKPTFKTALLPGILGGLMYYAYFHYWTFLTLVIGLLFVFSLFTIRKQSERFKSFLILLGMLFLITIPYWLNFIDYQNSSTSEEVARRIGVAPEGRYFHFIKPFPIVLDYLLYLLLAGLVYLLFYKRKKDVNTAIFYWIAIASMFIIWQVQLVIGFTVHPDHWFRAVNPFVFIILFHSAYEILKRIKYRTAASVLIILSTLLIVKKAINASVFINPPQDILENYTFNSDIIGSWDWINKNFPHEPKIISPSYVTSLYLNTQTSVRPYLAGGFNTAVSNKVLEERFLNTYKVFEVSYETLEGILTADIDDLCPWEREDCSSEDFHKGLNTIKPTHHIYVNYYRTAPGRPEFKVYRYISKEKADELLFSYRNLDINWNEIPADYVYYGPWEKQLSEIDLGKNKDLELVFQNSGVEIYKIRK